MDEKTRLSRGFVVSMTIKSFKRHENVVVHLFRANWNQAEESSYPWEQILGDPIKTGQNCDPGGSRKVFLETFSKEEKEYLISYLHDRYQDKLSAIEVGEIPLPIPLGLAPLSEIQDGGPFGILRLEDVPNYPLEFTVHGIYNLSSHNPLE